MLDEVKSTKSKVPARIKVEAADQQIARLSITVDGIKPLLTHNPASMGQSSGAKRGSRVPEAADEAEAGTYRLDDGTCAIKGDAFRAAILGAAGAWKAKGKTTMKSHLSHILIVEELVALLHRDGTPITSYEIDERRAIVGKAGILRHRPRFPEWSAMFTVEYDTVLVPGPDIILQITNDAGARIGVGDYRPQKNGPFGRFAVRDYCLEG
jgi:hypothetical protein